MIWVGRVFNWALHIVLVIIFLYASTKVNIKVSQKKQIFVSAVPNSLQSPQILESQKQVQSSEELQAPVSPSRQRQSSKNPSQTRKGFHCENLAYQGLQDGASKSNLRLQLGKMKKREKDLEIQITSKDAELIRLKEKMSEKAQESMKDELKRAYDVLRHLKKKVGPNSFSEEYRVVMSEIREALGISSIRKNKRSNIVGDSLPC